MEKILLEKNGYSLEWEDAPHGGPPILVLKMPTEFDKEGNPTKWGKLLGEAILDAVKNLDDYYDRLEAAKKAAKDAVLAAGRLLEKLDPTVLEQRGKQDAAPRIQERQAP